MTDRLLKLAFLLQGTHEFYFKNINVDEKIEFVKEVSHRFEELNVPEEHFGSSMYLLICEKVSDISGDTIEKNFQFDNPIKIVYTSGELKGRESALIGRLIDNKFLDSVGIVRDLTDVDFLLK